jgi:hypothetical protein
MNELIAWCVISVALFFVCIIGCSFMLCDKISDLTHEMRELRMDLKRGEDDEQD